MAIGPIELQGTVMRTQDFTQVKHNEDQRGVVEQLHFQDQLKKEVQDKSSQVNKKDRPENQSRKFDAKEKGDNEYYRQDKGQKKKSGQALKDAHAMLKKPGGFDISV